MTKQSPTKTDSLPDNLIGRLSYFADNTPEHDAIVTAERTVSYKQLNFLVQQQTIALAEKGINPDSIVGIHCSDELDHLILCLAVTALGATSYTVPSYEQVSVRQSLIAHCKTTTILEQSDVIALDQDVTSPTVVETLDDACLLFSTSGTTGKPKLVEHLSSGIVAQAHRHISDDQERFACLAAIEHNFAKRHRLYCIAMGATNVFVSDIDQIGQLCQQLDINVLHVSSFQAQELLNLPDRDRLSGIRLKLGGSHIPYRLRTLLKQQITQTVQFGYGTTETGAIAFTDPSDNEAAESVGQALPGITVKVVDEKGKALTTGERGQVVIHGAGMFRAYRGQADLTAQRLVEDWFYTGDLGYLDQQDRIHLSGRSDDMFTFNSINIYPQEIESEIRQFPDVIDAVVLAKESTIHGHIPVALVVFNKNIKPDVAALEKFVQNRVGLRCPRQFTIVDSIPTTTSGKVSRLSAAKLTEQSDQIRQQVLDLINEKYQRQVRSSQLVEFAQDKMDLSFNTLNMDSLARLELLVSLETQYDIIITPQELVRLRTLGNLAARVLTLSQATSQATIEVLLEQDETQIQLKPWAARLFQRLFPYCQSATDLNQLFTRLEHRLTPIDIAALITAHYQQQLLPKDAEPKYHQALTAWLTDTQQLMLNSGKKQVESFSCKKIAPAMMMFSTPSSSAEKTLIMAFPPRGVRHFTVPNAVLLQHIDAEQYDVLLVSEQDYQFGSFPFGKKLKQQIEWFKQQAWIKQYKQIRTLGYSAGSFPAIATAYALHAELALSLAGRFHKPKHALINIDKLVTSPWVLRQGHCKNVLLTYSIDNGRDSWFAQVAARLFNGKPMPIEIKTEKLPHLLLRRLVERAELASYFTKTLFSDLDQLDKKSKTSIEFPTRR